MKKFSKLVDDIAMTQGKVKKLDESRALRRGSLVQQSSEQADGLLLVRQVFGVLQGHIEKDLLNQAQLGLQLAS